MNNLNKPIKSRSLSAQIYNNLLERIQNGGLDPEERLVDIDLAAQLGVSRMPVREALLRLQNEGYVMGTSRGFRLPELSTSDMEEIFEIRLLLEPIAAQEACLLLTEEQLQLLTQYHADSLLAHKNNNVQAFISANALFRKVWLDSASNKRLVKLIKRFADHVQTVRYKTLKTAETRLVVIETLWSLLISFQKKDPTGAYQAMHVHLTKAQEVFFTVLNQDGDTSHE